LLFSYDPVSNLLTDLAPLLPSNFEIVKTMAAQEMLWTPSGLYLLLQGPTGNLFGVLSQNEFTDISSLLPSSFTVPIGNGYIANLFAYLLAWNGTQLFIAGQNASNGIALLAFNPSSNQMTDYSSLYAGFTGTPFNLAYSNGYLYLSGFTDSAHPILTALDGSLNLINLTPLVPASFGVIDTLAVNGPDIFISGGTSWGEEIQYGLLSMPSGNVSVTNAASSRTAVGQGFCTNITVTAVNQDDFTETFNVTAYANEIIIGSENVTLPAGTSTTVTFVWNSTSFAYGNYTISAYALPVVGEANTANNNCTGGWIIVSVIGDITGPSGWSDGVVNMRDIALIARCFGSTPGSGNWNPNADINGDGAVNMRDIALVARQFGNHT
jgi:hypothetical protein